MTRGFHPRSFGWASLRLNLAVERLLRETGIIDLIDAVLDRLAVALGSGPIPPRAKRRRGRGRGRT